MFVASAITRIVFVSLVLRRNLTQQKSPGRPNYLVIILCIFLLLRHTHFSFTQTLTNPIHWSNLSENESKNEKAIFLVYFFPPKLSTATRRINLGQTLWLFQWKEVNRTLELSKKKTSWYKHTVRCLNNHTRKSGTTANLRRKCAPLKDYIITEVYQKLAA